MGKQGEFKFAFLDGFWLKLLAFVFMTVDHLGVFLQMYGLAPEAASACRFIGRLAFPLFIFLLAEGMRLSHHRGKYILRVFLMYAIITIPETFILYFPPLANSIGISPTTLDGHPFIDILFVGSVIYCLTLKGWKKLLALLPAAFIFLSFYYSVYDPFTPYFPMYLRSGYGLFGLLLGLCYFGVNKYLDFYQMNGRLLRNLLSIGALFLAFITFYVFALTLPQYAVFGSDWAKWETPCVIAALFLLFYNGKRGYDAAWWRVFSYSYYLIHMAVLFVVFMFIG